MSIKLEKAYGTNDAEASVNDQMKNIFSLDCVGSDHITFHNLELNIEKLNIIPSAAIIEYHVNSQRYTDSLGLIIYNKCAYKLVNNQRLTHGKNKRHKKIDFPEDHLSKITNYEYLDIGKVLVSDQIKSKDEYWELMEYDYVIFTEAYKLTIDFTINT